MKRHAGHAQIKTPSGLMGDQLAWKQFHQGAWEPGVSQPADGPSSHDSLSVLSYNIWFMQHRRQSRFLALVRLLQEEMADCVCLQEMTPSVLRELLRNEFVRAHYCCSTTVEEFEELAMHVGYDVVMLCRPWLATGDVARFRLTSRYGRTFLVCSTTINGVPLALGTVHLESTTTQAEARARQLREIYSILAECEPYRSGSIMCGDWNHCETLNEHHFDDRISLDVWPTLYPGQEGWTEDTQQNAMLRGKHNALKQVRFDRIAVNGAARERVEPVEMRVVGRTPVPANQLLPATSDPHDPTYGNDVWISDHFGVVAKFRFK